ncbi:MAG: hypothetical protein LBC53_04650 [Spirochaetaceae bacterium]|nr:hypothetical protein [Spirochaetaceae bacterium]
MKKKIPLKTVLKSEFRPNHYKNLSPQKESCNINFRKNAELSQLRLFIYFVEKS